MNPAWLALTAILVSTAAVPLIVMLRNRPNLREAATFLAGAIKFGCVLALYPLVSSGQVVELTLWEFVPGLPIALRVDGLGLLFALVASSLWLVTSAFSIGYMRGSGEGNQTRFYAFFALSLSATIGVAFSANLLTLYLFYELLSLSTFPLVTHHGDREARSGGRRYLYFLLSTSIGFVLPAMLYVFVRTGNLNFQAGGVFDAHLDPTLGLILLLAFVFGFAKAAVMPFHGWLPGAMVAPTPVSALLHAVAVVKVGVFSILRVVTGIFGIEFLRSLDIQIVVTVIASVTVILSSLIALTQDNLKRRLAYSTIGQLSYIVLGVSILSERAVSGASLHILMHAFGKITLFLCAGAIFVTTGKKYISQMVGLGRRMPVTMAAFFIGSLSVIGLPPTGGFVSKLQLLLGTVDARAYWVLAVYLVSSLLNAAYFLPIVYRGFFSPESGREVRLVEEAPGWCLGPLCFTALVSVGLFFGYKPFLQLIQVFLEAM